MKESYKGRDYSYTDHGFLLSPEAAILRNLAESLYPAYLSRLQQEGKALEPVSVPALDDDFVRSSEAIWFRVLSETIYAEIVLRQHKVKHTVLWFGSARYGTPTFTPSIKDLPDYYQQSKDLSVKITRWSLDQRKPEEEQPFLICTGGGHGMMEAGNEGSHLAGGNSIGLNIYLPFEQDSNPYISDKLAFNFQYFFTRKFHFLRRAKAAVVFPGGFGSMDELFETLTLIQTGKIDPIKIILFGKRFWKDVINFDKLVEYGTISKKDLKLFEYQDTVEGAFNSLTKALEPFLDE